MFQHVSVNQLNVRASPSTASTVVNVSTSMDDNEDDDRLLNQALDDAELLFCADDDDELVRL